MVDFSKLLRKPAGEAKKPEPLPAGNYPAIIKSHEVGDANKNKTPYVRFQIGYTGWPDDVTEDERLFDGKPIDLSKKAGRVDMYLTDESLWRLDEMLVGLGHDPKGRSYEEVLPETTGTPCVAVLVQRMNQNTNEIMTLVDRILPAE